jgi:hypothetical protein
MTVVPEASKSCSANRCRIARCPQRFVAVILSPDRLGHRGVVKGRFGSKADTRSSRAFGIGVGIGGFLKKMLEDPFDAFTFSTGSSVGLSARQLRDGAQGTQDPCAETLRRLSRTRSNR